MSSSESRIARIHLQRTERDTVEVPEKTQILLPGTSTSPCVILNALGSFRCANIAALNEADKSNMAAMYFACSSSFADLSSRWQKEKKGHQGQYQSKSRLDDDPGMQWSLFTESQDIAPLACREDQKDSVHRNSLGRQKVQDCNQLTFRVAYHSTNIR